MQNTKKLELEQREESLVVREANNQGNDYGQYAAEESIYIQEYETPLYSEKELELEQRIQENKSLLAQLSIAKNSAIRGSESYRELAEQELKLLKETQELVIELRNSLAEKMP